MAALSKREAEVLAMAGAGMSDAEIAVASQVSIHTIRGYWLRIRAKLGDGSRSKLVAEALKAHAGEIAELVAEKNRAAAEAAQDQSRAALKLNEATMDRLLKGERDATDEVLAALLTKEQRLKLDAIRNQTDGALNGARKSANLAKGQPDETDRVEQRQA